MSDGLEENPIIIGLQIFIFVFLVIALIVFIWFCYNNSSRRAVFRAKLPNHLPYLKNSEIPSFDLQENNKESLDSQNSIKGKNQTYSNDPRKMKNFLPATLTPHGTKSSISTNDDINKISDEMFTKIIYNELHKEENNNTETIEESGPIKDVQSSSSIQQVQQEGLRLTNEAKERSKQKKKEDEEKRKQSKKENKESTNESDSNSGFGLDSSSGSSFNFGNSNSSGFNFNFDFGNTPKK